MATDYCPICYSALEVRDVAPCARCGHLPHEIDHALAGQHQYSEMRLFGALSVVLCDFCQVDFDSYDPGFFGLPRASRLATYGKMEYVRKVDPMLMLKDKYCPACSHRLAFLEFINQARRLNGQE